MGRVLEPLGPSLAVFWFLFLRLCAQEGLRGLKRRPRALLGSILGGSGGVLGGVWEDFGDRGGVGTVCRNDGFRHTVFCRNLVALDTVSGVLGGVWEDLGAQNSAHVA